MSSRVKILSCGSVERLENNILQEVQVQVLDTKTGRSFNVICELNTNDTDSYTIRICNVSSNSEHLIDSCIVDSSGGIVRNEGFACDELDEEFTDEVLDLMVNNFIVEF